MTRAPVKIGPHPRPAQTKSRAEQLLHQPGFRPLLVTLFGVGVVLGTVEIAVPAFAQQHHGTATTGLLLAVLSLGSIGGGLYYGRRTWRQPPAVRLVTLAAVLTVASFGLAAAQHVVVLAVLLIVVGLFLAPALITGYLLADDLSPAHARTEASSWTNTASNAGAAASAAMAGVLVDHASTTAAFTAGAGLAALCVLLAASTIPSMTRNRPTHQPNKDGPRSRAKR